VGIECIVNRIRGQALLGTFFDNPLMFP
jgi:hypothetical protein